MTKPRPDPAIITEFRSYMQEKGYTKEAVKGYGNSMRNYLAINPKANSYEYCDVLSSIEQKAYRPLTISARKTILIYIKKYYDFLLDTGRRDDHPCRQLNLKGRIDKTVIHSDLFTMAELELMFKREGKYKKLIPKNKAIISLLLYQGMTVAEIIRLKVSDIDLDAGIISITGGQLLTSRRLEIKPKQYGILHDYINTGRKRLLKCKTDSFAIGLTGLPDALDNTRKLLKSLKPLYPDKNLNAMAIRDSVICYWLNECKIPLEQVQLMAGHRWISCTERYVQVSTEEQKEILKKYHPLG
ncbi:MAG TPA: tyrosine-type recombinase/integrase [Bacteroidia bacterium]|jgi:integrase/recombinase XerD|nr:tyrosine-type recombinase/integrase [Bacteroidia bacterium]